MSDGRHRAGDERTQKHRGAKPGRRRAQRQRRSGRAIAGVAATVGAVVLLTGPGTLAYWADAGSMTSGTFGAGTLDLTLNSNQGNPSAWANTTFALSTMVPGEAIANSFPVQNAGTVTFTYTATATASGSLAPYLTFEAYVGGTATNGTSGGLRTASCSGTSMSSLTLTASDQTVIGTAQSVAASASQNVCLKATLATTAPSSVQGASATATYTFSAKQVGAP